MLLIYSKRLLAEIVQLKSVWTNDIFTQVNTSFYAMTRTRNQIVIISTQMWMFLWYLQQITIICKRIQSNGRLAQWLTDEIITEMSQFNDVTIFPIST